MVLAACQAEDIEIEMSADALLDAFNGKTVTLEFEATVGEQYTQVDDDKRLMIENIKKEITSFLPDADIELDIGSNEYEIEIEGRIVAATEAPSSGAPYFVKVSEGPLDNSVLVTLEPSGTFPEFAAALRNINLMVSPDEFQGAEFKLKGDGQKVLVFGSYIDGEPITVQNIELSDQWRRVDMKENIWTKTPPGILLMDYAQ
jgi:hypothetical protein